MGEGWGETCWGQGLGVVVVVFGELGDWVVRETWILLVIECYLLFWWFWEMVRNFGLRGVPFLSSIVRGLTF